MFGTRVGRIGSIAISSAVFSLVAWWAQAKQITAYYQPTPYPPSISANPPEDGTGIHVLDGWLPSVYYKKKFQTSDDRLQVGGWADLYYTYMQFDLKGLPQVVDSATLMLYSYPRDDGSSLTAFTVSLPKTKWADATNLTTNMKWDNQPDSTLIGSYDAGTQNSWWNIDLTASYKSWQSGSSSNFGIVLKPDFNNNNFDVFRASRYSDDGFRPILQLTYTPPVPVPQLKLPLPGGESWLITTEAGGHDCMGLYDSNHTGKNYFSIDFSWKTKGKHYKQNDKIPVLAAGDGTVQFAGEDPNKPENGKFVIVRHGAVGGYQTRYLHLDTIAVSKGDTVTQGLPLGNMGNTGTESDGKHLHFGVRYGGTGGDDDGSGSYSSPVQYIVVDGWLLKSIQTECSVDANGFPIAYNRYYRSSNKT